jgi:photosystem II stability/assembly factor-like uncharacterized protein
MVTKTMRFLISILILLAVPALQAQQWRPMGPPGGDVRSLVADPVNARRIYLGTSDGHIFGSRDAGQAWSLLGRVGHRQDTVVTTILVDPRDSEVLYAAAWTQDPLAGGGVFRSEDGGRTWEPAGLEGQAVRALAQAPSAPDILVAGTLDGVYRSRDSGQKWQRISPENHEEIRNLDSVAIDPRNPDIIYAGTFHLPWKTTDAGKNWFPIHDGMIDDSDVFSIVVDRTNPRRIFASACSGIYRSDNAGALWKKIQGIPFSARRTHVILQDPEKPSTIYAGTTEGLWLTHNAGATWRRVTPKNWVINAAIASRERSGRLVLGTERLGVIVSDDGGESFSAANTGFYHRQIVALALDRDHPDRVLAVLTNAPEPVLATEDGGQTWTPLGPGLTTEGLLRVYSSPDGWWAALERGGLMRYDEKRRAWARTGSVVGEAAETVDRKGKRIAAKGPVPLRLVVSDLAFSSDVWFAATPEGLLASRDSGATWSVFPFAPLRLPVSSVRVSRDGQKIWLVSLRGMVISRDAGQTWAWSDLPFEAGGALRLDVAPGEDDNTLLATARNGLYVSRDAGRTWQQAARGIPAAPAQDVALVGDVFLVSLRTQGLYISYDRGGTWSRIEGTLAEGYFPVVATREAANIVFAASATEGLYAVELEKKAGAAASNGSTSRKQYSVEFTCQTRWQTRLLYSQ